MKFNKKIINKIKTLFLNKRFLVIFFTFLGLFLFLLILFISIYGSYWRFWPKNIRANIALNRLAISVYEEPYCRTKCYIERSHYRQAIILNISNKKFFKKIKEIIFNEEENVNWRIELIKTLSLLDYVDFDDFQDYLNSDFGKLEIKEAIISYFLEKSDTGDYIDYLKTIIMDDFKSIDDRVIALRNLASLNLIFSDFYLSMLVKERNDVLKIDILRSLGADDGRFDVDRELLFLLLEDILRLQDSSFSSRRLALFILSDFLLSDHQSEVYKLFEKIIYSEEIDDFSRYFAIDIFNNYSEDRHKLPSISEDEWLWYYLQK